MVAFEQAGLLELGERPVNGCQSDFNIFIEKQAIDIVGGQVAHFGIFEKLEDLQTGERCFEPHAVQFGGFAHGVDLSAEEGGVLFGYDIPPDTTKRTLASLRDGFPTIYQETATV